MLADNVYVIKSSHTDLKDPNCVTEKVDIIDAYTDLTTAKQAARSVLLNE
jgi:hypothetical protein